MAAIATSIPSASARADSDGPLESGIATPDPLTELRPGTRRPGTAIAWPHFGARTGGVSAPPVAVPRAVPLGDSDLDRAEQTNRASR